MDRLMFIDTETGGLDPSKCSLLTIGIVVWDKELGILYKREICQKLDFYKIDAEALAINNFEISSYSKEDVLSPEEIYKEIINIKNSYFADVKHIPLAGHNIQFDCAFLREMFNSIGISFGSIFSHRQVDTFSILQYLIHSNVIPKEVSNSTAAFDYFKIKVNGRHTALGDALATAELYSVLISINQK